MQRKSHMKRCYGSIICALHEAITNPSIDITAFYTPVRLTADRIPSIFNERSGLNTHLILTARSSPPDPISKHHSNTPCLVLLLTSLSHLLHFQAPPFQSRHRWLVAVRSGR